MTDARTSAWQRLKGAIGHSAELVVSIALISVCAVVGAVALYMDSGDQPASAAVPARAQATPAPVATEESDAVRRMQARLSSTLEQAAEERRRQAEAERRAREAEAARRREAARQAAERREAQRQARLAAERREAAEQARREARLAAQEQTTPSSRAVADGEGEGLDHVLASLQSPDAPPAEPARPDIVQPTLDWSTCKPPEYPRWSVRAGEEGVVEMAFSLDAEGRVLDSRVIESSGFERLDRTALSAISKCRFRPATQDGQAVASQGNVRFAWRLDGP